jgi:hypothetical protein
MNMTLLPYPTLQCYFPLFKHQRMWIWKTCYSLVSGFAEACIDDFWRLVDRTQSEVNMIIVVFSKSHPIKGDVTIELKLSFDDRHTLWQWLDQVHQKLTEEIYEFIGYWIYWFHNWFLVELVWCMNLLVHVF